MVPCQVVNGPFYVYRFVLEYCLFLPTRNYPPSADNHLIDNLPEGTV